MPNISLSSGEGQRGHQATWAEAAGASGACTPATNRTPRASQGKVGGWGLGTGTSSCRGSSHWTQEVALHSCSLPLETSGRLCRRGQGATGLLNTMEYQGPGSHAGGAHCGEGTGWSVVVEGFNGTNWEATKEHKGIIKTMSEDCNAWGRQLCCPRGAWVVFVRRFAPHRSPWRHYPGFSPLSPQRSAFLFAV
ncbi:hypothetical protein GH733_016788 [Mirounga leonina]|nr:hypothetical protein GH733_016788 [Mirounga leonina]